MKINKLLILFVLSLTGCGWFENEQGALPAIPVSEVSDIQYDRTVDSSNQILLNLNQGDRFPMKKTVESTLTQKMGSETISSESWLEMLMTIHVERVEKEKTLLSVHYQRIRYRQKIGEQKVEYDSSIDRQNLPVEALSYSGLVNNGFKFWLGRDNKIIEVVDFDRFLERCAEKYPAEQRSLLLAHLSASSGDDELANFVDDSIGILPYDSKTGIAAVSEGETWARNRKYIHPTTMYLKSKCLLRKLTKDYAEIDVSGTVAATGAQLHSSGNTDYYIRIRDGKALGKCTIDRVTGLPVYSKMDLILEMLVLSSDGQQIPQQKTITTTIESYPVDGGPVLHRTRVAQKKNKTNGIIQQTSGTSEN